jgi:pimeloyl-ACP methyl ester carboxylesterase
MGEERGGAYAEVNGLSLYYEVHGEGEPLILLHGGVGAIEMFGEVLPLLARGRRVIGVDLQAHGRTADIDRPMTYEAMADDMAALIEHLGVGEADVMGYSLGGGVALQTAIRHPEAVRKAVLVSTPFKRDGWYPEVRYLLLLSHAGVGRPAVPRRACCGREMSWIRKEASCQDR